MTWGFYGLQAELKQLSDIVVLDGHVARFMASHRRYADWSIENVSIAPAITPEVRARLEAPGHRGQDLTHLTTEFHRAP